MKRLAVALLILAALVGSSLLLSGHGVGSEADTASIRAALEERLALAEYRPVAMEDGVIGFHRYNDEYRVFITRAYIVFAAIDVWSIDSDRERRPIMDAADYANRRSYVAKTYTVGEAVWIAVELPLPEPGEIPAALDLALEAIDSGIGEFTWKMMGELSHEELVQLCPPGASEDSGSIRFRPGPKRVGGHQMTARDLACIDRGYGPD